MGQEGARPKTVMFKTLRKEFERHRRSILNGGFWVTITYRYGRWTLRQRLRPWRMLASIPYFVLHHLTTTATKVYIDRTTQIGEDLHLIHAILIQIHPRAVIGDRCGIMHGVTIGTNMSERGLPVIGNDVFIGCNSSVLGDVNIGDNARIAANSLVIRDVPAGAVAMGVPARVLPSLPSLMRGNPSTMDQASTAKLRAQV